MANGQPAREKELPTLNSLIMVFGLFLLMFLAWLYFGAIGFGKAVVSKNWPTASGIVISAPEVSKSGKQTRYGLDVRYSYKVGQQEYEAIYFKETPTRGTPAWTAVKNRYAVNSRLVVYYNPENPKDTVLEPGLRKDNYFMVFVPLGAIAVILAAFVSQIRQKKYRIENR